MVYDIKEYKYTIFTPTFNRKKLLPRAYESLLRQSFKDFIWLIVDDGSNDGTEQMVESWKRDNLLKIEYIYKENGGKYSAMVKAFHLISTKYCITLDSDDELTHDAISVFDKQWDLIESQGLENEVVEIRANSVYSDNGDIVGNFSLSDKQTYLDTTWHIFYFRMNATNECLSCHKTILLKNVFNPAELFWLSGKFKSIQESVFWSRYNKHGKLRYISRNLRIYHRDADNSILRHTISETGYFDELVSYKYFLSENMEFIHYAPKIYLNYIVKYFLCGFILKIGLQNLFSEARGLRFKIWLIVTLPISIAALMYFKFIRKNFGGIFKQD
jgi:glycosyltransferase involved in cell wall biosynthesis